MRPLIVFVLNLKTNNKNLIFNNSYSIKNIHIHSKTCILIILAYHNSHLVAEFSELKYE